MDSPAPVPPAVEAPEPEFPDFADAEELTAAVEVPDALPEPPPAEEAPEPGESEDLWSEVSLRDRPSASPGEDALEEDALWESGGSDVFEEGAASEGEDVFQEVTTARLEPFAVPEAVVPAEPQAAYAPEEASAEPGPAEQPEGAEAAAISVSAEELERLVAARLEDAVRAVLEPLAQQLVRRIVEEVAWETVPELAETMIRAEIERVRRESEAG